MADKTKILVVDDEETLCEALRFNLEEEGYDVDVALSAEEALTLNLADYSLILLDIMMGEISGVQLASILKRKEATARIPIIFCTAKDGEDDMVRGLDLGADDYITKPYSIRNVLARVRTVLRRSVVATSPSASMAKTDVDETIVYKGISVFPSQKICKVNGVEVKMPKKEFEILSMLLRNSGRVFSREEILKTIWPEEVVVIDRVVDVNITRLRSKLGEYSKNIVTKAGYGYGFMD